MSFSDLPITSLALIISNLPVDEQVRISRVNKYFMEASKMAISTMTNLDLSDKAFDRLTYFYPASLANLLKANSTSLKTVKFPAKPWPLLISTYAQFGFPSVINLDLAKSDIDPDLFDQIIRNSPNLEHLIWANPHPSYLRYPSFISQQLRSIKINRLDDQSIQSLTGNCPNLNLFEASYLGPVPLEMMDAFFATVPNLESIVVFNFFGRFPINGTHFWKLGSLRKLIMNWRTDRDRRNTELFIQKVGESFADMEILELDMVGLTNDGVSSLGNLKNLRRLKMVETNRKVASFLDDGIRDLMERLQNLEELIVQSSLSPRTFTHILRFCNDLAFMEINGVFNVESGVHAAQIVRSVSPNRQSKLIISILDYHNRLHWKSVAVGTALDHIMKLNGHMIEFQ